jgi:hypothetical protein
LANDISFLLIPAIRSFGVDYDENAGGGPHQLNVQPDIRMILRVTALALARRA